MFLKNKRGISPVIATVFLILLALVLVAVVWVMASNFIDSQTKTKKLCSDAISQIKILNRGHTCYLDNGDGTFDIFVHIDRGPFEFDLVDIEAILWYGGSALPISMTNPNPSLPTSPGYPIVEPNSDRVYAARDLKIIKPETVELSPVIFDGVKNVSCGVATRANLGLCNSDDMVN